MVEFLKGYQQIVTTKANNLMKKYNFISSINVKIMKVLKKIINNATIAYSKELIVGTIT